MAECFQNIVRHGEFKDKKKRIEIPTTIPGIIMGDCKKPSMNDLPLNFPLTRAIEAGTPSMRSHTTTMAPTDTLRKTESRNPLNFNIATYLSKEKFSGGNRKI